MIVVGRHHDLGLAKAKRLAETIAQQLREDYGGFYAWKGNHLHFRRTGASGRVSVTKDDFEVRVELGFLLAPLSSRLEREIHLFCNEHFGEDGTPARSPSSTPRSARRSTRSR
jgi:putative polyhydroxyalkanoate system protein